MADAISITCMPTHVYHLISCEHGLMQREPQNVGEIMFIPLDMEMLTWDDLS